MSKKIMFLAVLFAIGLSACSNNAAKAEEEAKIKAEVEKLDSSSTELDKINDAIKQKKAELDSLMKDIEKN